MDQEKLIESVKSWEALYVISHSRYCDNVFKENAWRAIAKEINQSAAVCKKTWNGLRDSYRRALKKKRRTKRGVAASRVKKWKFEDEMSFLLPYMHERDTCINLREISDDDNEDEQNTDECNDNNDDRGDDRNDNRSDDEADDNNESNAGNEKSKRQLKINKNIIAKVHRNKGKNSQAQSETSSAVAMEFLEKKTPNATITTPAKQRSAIESFFSSIAATVENFSPYYQNIAKSKIFAIVTDLEMQQIMEQQKNFKPQQSRRLYQTGQYNVYPSPASPSVSTMTTQSPTPSTSATPTPPPFYHGLPEANQMAHEEVFYNECAKIKIEI